MVYEDQGVFYVDFNLINHVSCVHRSVFKPFVFVPDIKQLKHTCSPCYGEEDPVKKKPRFQSKPNRKHPLFLKHEVVASIIDSTGVSSQTFNKT